MCMVVQALQQTVVALRLRHPNIVTVMGTSVDPPTGNLLLVTALLERGTLYDLLHNDTVSAFFLVFTPSPSLPLMCLLACSLASTEQSAHTRTCENQISHRNNHDRSRPFGHIRSPSLTRLLTHTPTHSLIHSLTYSLTHPPVHLLTSCIHAFT